MDFVPIDLKNSSIIGETYGTVLLLASKDKSVGKSSHYKIDVSERWQKPFFEGTYLPVSRGCQ